MLLLPPLLLAPTMLRLLLPLLLEAPPVLLPLLLVGEAAPPSCLAWAPAADADDADADSSSCCDASVMAPLNAVASRLSACVST